MSKNIKSLSEVLDKKQEIHVGLREIFIASMVFTISYTLRPLFVAIYDKIFGLDEKNCPILYNLFLLIFIIIIIIIFDFIYKANFKKTEEVSIVVDENIV